MPDAIDSRRSEAYYETKSTIFGALIEAIDLAQLARLDADSAREEIRDIVNEIIAIKNIVMSISEQEELLDDICNDVLGYGPLEPLLARDDIADIMVNGSGTVYIEVNGKIQKTGIRFRDNQQLLNICQRIVSQIGRRVDESSPICDARLPDGSRVNVIVPPLAIDGPALTIRKFKKDKLTLDQLVKFGTITPAGRAKSCSIIGRCRVNTLVSGGTGSGKTTLLNCLTQFIDDDERIITCEDAAELQLQQPHVVRLETRPPNLEGEGQVTMRDLVQQLPAHAAGAHHRRRSARTRSLRPAAGDEHRPRRLDGHAARQQPARGAVAPRIDDHHGRLLAALAHHPRDDRAPRSTSSIQAARLRDGSRRITHITEVMGMEGDVIITQDLFVYDMIGEDANGKIIGRHRSTGIGRPRFWDRARYYGEEQRLAAALDAAEAAAAQTLSGGVAMQAHRHVLPGCRRGRRRRLGLRLSDPVRRAEGRAAHGERRQAGAGARAATARPAEVAARAGRGDAQGARGAPQEAKSRAAVGAHRAGRADLVEAAVPASSRSCSASAAVLAVLLVERRRPARRRGAGLCRRLRPAALAAVAF